MSKPYPYSETQIPYAAIKERECSLVLRKKDGQMAKFQSPPNPEKKSQGRSKKNYCSMRDLLGPANPLASAVEHR